MSVLSFLLKPFMGNIDGEISAMIESVLKSVADENKISQYHLSAVLAKKEDVAVLEIFDFEANPLYEADGGEIIEEIFKKQLAVMGEYAASKVMEQMDGETSIAKLVLMALEQGSLMANYDENLKMQFFQVTAETVTPIDIKTFISENLA